MRTWILRGGGGAALALACFAGCSGGGSSGGSTPEFGANPRVAPTSTATPSPSSPAPGLVPGSSYYFVGNSQNTDTTYDGSAAANVTGITMQTGTESNDETVIANATFAGSTGLEDVHEAVSDVAADPPSEFFDNYETVSPTAAGADLLYVGNSYSAEPSGGDTFSAVDVNAEPQVIDVLPHGAGSPWVLNPANTFTSTQTSPSIGTLDTTIQTASDGTYVRTDDATYPGGSYVQTSQMNADFSGTRSVVYGSDQYPSTVYAYAAPSGGEISSSSGSGNGSAPPTSTQASIVDWYPVASGAAAPIPYSQTSQDLGSAAVPPACLVAKQYAALPVWDIRTILNYFDIWGNDAAAGTFTTQTQDEYVNDVYGELCVSDSTSILAYSSQTGHIVEKSLTSGAIALQSAQLPAAAGTRAGRFAPLYSPIRGDAAARLRTTLARFERTMKIFEKGRIGSGSLRKNSNAK
jgi:hypothetical protein